MAEPTTFLSSLAIALGVAGVTTVVCDRLRLPLILGYLLAGILVGPHVPFPLVAEPDVVRQLAELGVTLLMFSIGLGFGVIHLVRAGLGAAIAAALEIGLCFWLGHNAALLLGFGPVESLFVGACLAISSTMVIGKTLSELKERPAYSRTVMSVLVVEDLVAVILIAVLTGLGSGRGLHAGELGAMLARLVGFLVIAVAGGLFVIPRAFRALARFATHETLLVASIGFCFLGAIAARASGYSAALGAFVAGTLIAESGVGKQVARLVEPLKNVFAGLFFVAVGMLLDPLLAFRYGHYAAALTAVLVFSKILGVSVGVFLAGQPTKIALQSGLAMAQIGEFSILMIGVGLATGAVRPELFSSIVLVATLTAATTPFLVRRSAAIAAWIDHRIPRSLQTFAALYGSWMEKLRATPESTLGSNLRRTVTFMLVDAFLVGTTCAVASVSMDGLVAMLGEHIGLPSGISRLAILSVAATAAILLGWGVVRRSQRIAQQIAVSVLPIPPEGISDLANAPRRTLRVATQTAIALAVGVPLVALTQPFVPPVGSAAMVAGGFGVLLFALWRSAADLQGHVRAGAEVIIDVLANQTRTQAPTLAAVEAMFPGLGTLVPCRMEGNFAIGKTLRDLDLRARTGATVLAIHRDGRDAVAPSPDERVASGDVLALAGSSEAVEAARRLLTRPAD